MDDGCKKGSPSTFMPKVTTVMSILKIRASESCHMAVYTSCPAGLSGRASLLLLVTLTLA